MLSILERLIRYLKFAYNFVACPAFACNVCRYPHSGAGCPRSTAEGPRAGAMECADTAIGAWEIGGKPRTGKPPGRQ